MADTARIGAGLPTPRSHALSTAPESCRSEEGITVGLVDALISIMRVLAPRDLSPKQVQEALADLFQDPDLRTVRGASQVGAQW